VNPALALLERSIALTHLRVLFSRGAPERCFASARSEDGFGAFARGFRADRLCRSLAFARSAPLTTLFKTRLRRSRRYENACTCLLCIAIAIAIAGGLKVTASKDGITGRRLRPSPEHSTLRDSTRSFRSAVVSLLAAWLQRLSRAAHTSPPTSRCLLDAQMLQGLSPLPHPIHGSRRQRRSVAGVYPQCRNKEGFRRCRKRFDGLGF